MLISSRSRVILNVALVISLLAALLISVTIGATNIPTETALAGVKTAITGDYPKDGAFSTVDLKIVSNIRFPRALLGAIVGAGLGICGLITQSLLRNPLGDPYILGISAGASTGAALVIVLGSSSLFLSSLGVTLGGFLGALVAIALVALLATAGGKSTPSRIIFAGMAVNYLFNALTSLITLMAKTAAGTKSVMFWTLGSLATVQWENVTTGAVATGIAFVLFLLFGRRVDLLNLGDDSARALGTNPRFFRNLLFMVVAFTVAVLVSLTGAIGFVGLVVPHLAKLLVGSTTRAALPVSALGGALLVVIADTCTRVVMRPAELPIGILTALVGTPMLMVLIRKHSK